MNSTAAARHAAGSRGSKFDKTVTNGTGPSAANSVIDVEAIDDEVVVLSPSTVPATLRRVRSRRQPVTLVIDEDVEIGSRLDVCGRTTKRRQRNFGTAVCDLTLDQEENSMAKRQQIAGKTAPEPVKVAPEPTFTCPVCLNKLAEASSTICGHIFCGACIKASIKAQKKCPTCRRKLNPNNFHRVYLPGTD